ncbi:NAD-dependent epimerase/dehydratase family protein [Actinacidiphila bryophytorum]|uniref:NAD-dependent epimerase/dehydratase family protein n=1 Tax=Actinacidiphila bryophytorum TaxID=1436133 RepID=UPI002176BB55|nr:NAD-dependent epimerase/dehydratase family protein [Actinacidiphila bryophytorum]UWE10066.1 NAD-dependent epimerase/dehydratase family protein [Actinacidiphila bryophytorum]
MPAPSPGTATTRAGGRRPRTGRCGHDGTEGPGAGRGRLPRAARQRGVRRRRRHGARRLPGRAAADRTRGGAAGSRWVALDLLAGGQPRLAEFMAAHRPDVVVNAAGTVWQADDRRMVELNDMFVRRLVRVLRTVPGTPRLVQLGSVHEYGKVPAGAGITEEWVPDPAGVYGRTKLRGSRWVLDGAACGLDAAVLRIANACGPGMPPRACSAGSPPTCGGRPRRRARRLRCG